MTDPNVMLASPSSTVAPTAAEAFADLNGRGWSAEIKWDGVRCLATTDNGAVTLTNRNGTDVTYRYPDVVEQLTVRIPTNGRWEFDGEIVAFPGDAIGDDTDTTPPDFELLARRDRKQNTPTPAEVAATPVWYAIFDILTLADVPVTGYPYSARTSALNELDDTYGLGYTPPVTSPDIFQWSRDQRYEGLILKDPTSPYRPGRSRSWVKTKHVHRASCIARSYVPGKGSLSHTVGALNLELLDGADLVQVGKVGSGMTDRDRAAIQARIDNGDFVIVEVEYANVTGGGTLRFPTFQGVRTDIGPDGCLLSQIR